jgi:hypothetical protein
VSGELVVQDQGGWISGPSVSTENVLAEDVEVSDRLLYDGRIAEVTDTRLGSYRFPEGRLPGVSIGWKAGNASGMLFRRASDLVQRVAGERR